MLVIYGHLAPRTSDSLATSTELIYSFHMPLFVFITGLYSNKKSCKAFFKSSLNIIVPLVLFQALNVLIHFIFIGQRVGLYDFIIPYWTLWYLLSMIYWRFLVQLVSYPITNKKKIALLLVSVFLSLSVNYIYGLHLNPVFGRIFSFQRTLVFLPYFCLGYCFKEMQVIERVRNMRWFFVLPCVIAACLIFYYYHGTDKMSIFSGADDCGTFVNRILSYVLAICMSVIFIRIVPLNDHTATIGKQTLGIYILHAIIVEYLFVDVFVDIYGYHLNLLEAICSSIFILYVSLLISQLNIVKRIMKPL